MATNDNQGMCSELFLLDISTSMGRRSSLFNLSGKTRFEMAKDFLISVLRDRMGSQTVEVAVAAYDRACVMLFTFRQITPAEIRQVRDLQPDGPTTATYDAYKECLEYMAEHSSPGTQQRRITLITDGGDNDSDPKTVEKYKNLQLRFSGQHLVIKTVLLHMPSNNYGWKQSARKLGWEYRKVRKTTFDTVVKDYLENRPTARAEMLVTERQYISYSQPAMNRTAVPPQRTPILQEQSKNTQAERRKTPAKEPVLA